MHMKMDMTAKYEIRVNNENLIDSIVCIILYGMNYRGNIVMPSRNYFYPKLNQGITRVHGELVVKPEPVVDKVRDTATANQNLINFHFDASFFRYI